jgi:hypothetical protein
VWFGYWGETRIEYTFDPEDRPDQAAAHAPASSRNRSANRGPSASSSCLKKT